MAEKLTANDIEKQDFPRKIRGFDPENVRLYLKSVGEEVGRLNLQNADFRRTFETSASELKEYRDREKSLHQALVAAQRLGEEITAKARKEADLLVREARGKAERLLGQAQDQLMRLEGDISHYKLERDAFEKRLRTVIEQHLNLIEMRSSEGTEKRPQLHSVTGREAG